MSRSGACEDCGRLIRARSRRCRPCVVARAQRRRSACRVCGAPISGLHPTCAACADAYWRAERARVRESQRREGRCYACERWHERATPGTLFCPVCVWQLDVLTALIAAACGAAGRAARNAAA